MVTSLLTLRPSVNTMHVMNRRIGGSLLALAGGACWGLSGCTGQYLFTHQGMPVYWLVPVRLGTAGLLILLYYLFTKPRLVFDIWRSKKNAFYLIVYGIFGVSMSQFTYFMTINLSSAGAATILQDVSPAIILFITCLQEKRKPRLLEIIAVLLAFVGVFLITTHGDVTNMAVTPLAVLTGLACAIFIIVYTMTAGVLQENYNAAYAGVGIFVRWYLFCARLSSVDNSLRTECYWLRRRWRRRAYWKHSCFQFVYDRREVHWC